MSASVCLPSAIDEPIELSPYDPVWSRWFRNDAHQLRDCLGPEVAGIEHFGSTSVEGMLAKPIIDILVAPARWPPQGAVLDRLESVGYEYFGEAGITGRHYLRRRGEHATNLALVEHGGALWEQNLRLRDFLRAAPAEARAYADSKQRAWLRGARTLLAYSEAKRPFLAALLGAACKKPSARAGGL